MTNATTYNVGDAAGWDLGVSGWENGKHFKVGDVLVFKYPKNLHSVVTVNKANYDSCTPTGKTLTSGNDKVTLVKGTNYFICGVPTHCQFDQKIAVTAN
ncbi:hypothetical protein HAX54_017645 [Datura stramonium]|uniref:Phytocyanin domain-containing protein n=1 Tax=Datura stramonium TaxID=4076 RepID=A0ABS8UN76_DATST|nr:hypothetical protein [Datura stramonium]